MEHGMHVLHSLAPKRRRNRSTKACWPCRDRKVRCDLQLPCSTCRKRGHVDLCHYGKRTDTPTEATSEITRQSGATAKRHQRFVVYVQDPAAGPSDRTRISVAANDRGNGDTVDAKGDTIIEFLDATASRLTETCETDAQLGETVYLGRNAPANFFRFMHAEDTPDVLPKKISLESAFALTNRTTLHPFGSIWSTVNVTLADVLKALPAAETCMRYYRVYTLLAQPTYHILADVDGFESRLLDFMQRVGEHGILKDDDPSLRASTFHDAAWYGLLFAVLGSGCQFSETEPQDRILRTRVFVVCAFECLRHANLYVQPSAEVIQCMLLLEITIANDSNPGVGFSLLGLTIQQAQALGMHLKLRRGSPNEVVHPLWTTVMAFDSTFSIAYDRKPMTFLQPPSTTRSADQQPTTLSFYDLMCDLQELRLHWQTTSTTTPLRLLETETLDHYLQGAEAIEHRAAEAIGTSQQATSIPSRIEQLFYNLHMSYFKAQIHRLTSLSSSIPRPRRLGSFDLMKESLRNVVQAFMTLKQLSAVPNVAWDVQQATMSSALLLAGIERALETAESQELLEKLARILPHCECGVTEAETEKMMEASYCHGLEALKFILNGTRAAVVDESDKCVTS